MSKTIRDLFTLEEWEALAQSLVPRLAEIADLPLSRDVQPKEADDDTQ